MIPNNFEYFAPATVDEALKLVTQYGEDSKILSGGHSLIPVLKLRLAAPVAVIDIGRIPDLKNIKVDGDKITIGACATHAEIAKSKALIDNCPLLSETASQIGDQQVRNRGTIGGSLTHADPAADWPAAILALDAELVARSKKGERVIKAADFFVDLMTSSLTPGEILTQIRISKPAQPKSEAYLKVPQSASGFAIVGVAVQLSSTGGKCESIAIGINGLSPKPFRASSVEKSLTGKALDESAVKAAAEKADAEAADAMDDIHASGEFRRNLARVYTTRAIMAALART